jgi:hypothetical protein
MATVDTLKQEATKIRYVEMTTNNVKKVVEPVPTYCGVFVQGKNCGTRETAVAR